MKRKIKSGVKIYLFAILYIFAACAIYSIILVKTNNEPNKIVQLLLGCSLFIVLGFAYSNSIHKKGFLVGALAVAVHLLLIKLGFFLSLGSFDISWLLIIIYVVAGSLGGMLGMFFKKVF